MKQRLLVMKGMPGSGKSTVSRVLSRVLGWPLVDKDDIKDVLDGRAPDPGGLAYHTMFNVARRQLLQGLSVICDSPLTFPGLYVDARQLASETGALLAVVECECPDQGLLRERIESRRACPTPSHRVTDWATYRAYFERVLPTTRYPISDFHLILDTTRPLDDVVAVALAWLEGLAEGREWAGDSGASLAVSR